MVLTSEKKVSFTPGKWRMRGPKPSLKSSIDVLGPNEDRYDWLASVHLQFTEDRPIEEAMANAKLIVAAPELAKALHDLLNMEMSDVAQTTLRDMDYKDQVQNAIEILKNIGL